MLLLPACHRLLQRYMTQTHRSRSLDCNADLCVCASPLCAFPWLLIGLPTPCRVKYVSNVYVTLSPAGHQLQRHPAAQVPAQQPAPVGGGGTATPQVAAPKEEEEANPSRPNNNLGGGGAAAAEVTALQWEAVALLPSF